MGSRRHHSYNVTIIQPFLFLIVLVASQRSGLTDAIAGEGSPHAQDPSNPPSVGDTRLVRCAPVTSQCQECGTEYVGARTCAEQVLLRQYTYTSFAAPRDTEISLCFLSNANNQHNEHGVNARLYSHLQNLLTNSPSHAPAVAHIHDVHNAAFPHSPAPSLTRPGVIYVIFNPHLPHFYYIGQTRHSATLRMQQHLRCSFTRAYERHAHNQHGLYAYMRRTRHCGWRTWAIVPLHIVPEPAQLHMSMHTDFRSRAFPYEYLYMRLFNSIALMA